MDSIDSMSKDEMKAMMIAMKEENEKLKQSLPPVASAKTISSSSSTIGASPSSIEEAFSKLTVEEINRKLAIRKIITSIYLDANQRGMKLSDPRNAAHLMNYKTTIIEYLNGKNLLFTIMDNFNGKNLLTDINNLYLMVTEEAKTTVYNFLKATMIDRVREQYATDVNKCDPKVLWQRLMTADVEEVNLPGVKKAKTTLLDAINLQFNDTASTAVQHLDRLNKAFAEYGHLVQYYRECGKNAVPIDNDDLSEGDKIVVLLNSITKSAKNEKAYEQLHRDILKVKTYSAACDEFKNAVGSRQALLAQYHRNNELSMQNNDFFEPEGVAASIRPSSGKCINCGKDGHRSGNLKNVKGRKIWVYECTSTINQCPKCNRWGHVEKYCKTPPEKYAEKNRYPNPNKSINHQSDNEQDGADEENDNEKNINYSKEESSGGFLRKKLTGKASAAIDYDKLIRNYYGNK